MFWMRLAGRIRFPRSRKETGRNTRGAYRWAGIRRETCDRGGRTGWKAVSGTRDRLCAVSRLHEESFPASQADRILSQRLVQGSQGGSAAGGPSAGPARIAAASRRLSALVQRPQTARGVWCLDSRRCDGESSAAGTEDVPTARRLGAGRHRETSVCPRRSVLVRAGDRTPDETTRCSVSHVTFTRQQTAGPLLPHSGTLICASTTP